jgi:formiminoglutamase
MSFSFQNMPDSLFDKNPKPKDPRIGEIAKKLGSEELGSLPSGLVICGYPSDEGIILNQGRAGAKEGPLAIRRALYRMAYRNSKTPIYDIGDFHFSSDLVTEHQVLQRRLQMIPDHHLLVSLGGGHDFAYPDGGSFLKRCENSSMRPLIINVDAHLDVREFQGVPHSGTPFFRLLEDFSNFDLIQFGILPQSNSSEHESYCLKKGVQIFYYSERHDLDRLQSLIGQDRPCFLSVDIDAFSSAIAPGSSAAQPLGLLWSDFEKLWQVLSSRVSLRHLGLYEVSPPLDRDEQTAKLAASLIYHLGSLA